LREWLTDEQRIQQVIPAQLPVVLNWSQQILQSDTLQALARRDSQRVLDSLAVLQLNSLRNRISERENLEEDKERGGLNKGTRSHVSNDMLQNEILPNEILPNEILPNEILIEELYSLLKVAANDDVRVSADRELYQIGLRSNPELDRSKVHSLGKGESDIGDWREISQWTSGVLYRGPLPRIVHEFHRLRSAMQKLDVVVGMHPYDFRVDTGELTRWESLEPFTLDSKYNSIGFYLARSQALKFIAIQGFGSHDFKALGGAAGNSNQSSQFEIFSSDDNMHWKQLRHDVLTQTEVLINGIPQLLFVLHQPSVSRFWKVHYISKARGEVYSGIPRYLVEAYGEKV
ncbi:MAG: hypothetical protein KDD60_11685, partial [Bdellovibrionales bacterium]|nr:hypothetical protein [Bdellovibrionales bacterium]